MKIKEIKYSSIFEQKKKIFVFTVGCVPSTGWNHAKSSDERRTPHSLTVGHTFYDLQRGPCLCHSDQQVYSYILHIEICNQVFFTPYPFS
jgi:hypothetical protein